MSMQLRGKTYVNLDELEADAKPLLTEDAYGYYSSGADSQWTLSENRAALHRYRLLPRCLVDVSNVDTSCELFGRKLAMPILVAPMAMQRLCDPDGELAMARAATAAGSAMILSTMATASVEEVAATGCSPLWFQIYVLTRRDVTAAMVKEAEALGYEALVVTVDAPRLGKREVDERRKFTLPPGLALKNLEKITAAAAQPEDGAEVDGSKFGRHFSKLIDDSLTWEFVRWLKGETKLPVLVKGILAPDDARKAVQHGVDGIIVSNHGGRQLDFAPSAVDMLPHVLAAVGGAVPVLVDGGLRRGTDVVKCLALGATAVLVGRPMLWALTLGGQDGVEQALGVLQDEVELCMALLGCRTVAEVTADFLIPPDQALRLPASRR